MWGGGGGLRSPGFYFFTIILKILKNKFKVKNQKKIPLPQYMPRLAWGPIPLPVALRQGYIVSLSSALWMVRLLNMHARMHARAPGALWVGEGGIELAAPANSMRGIKAHA
jgi:hypothetical protein